RPAAPGAALPARLLPHERGRRPPMTMKMTTFLRGMTATARLDLAEVLRSRWLLFTGAVYAVLVGTFLLVGTRESSVFGFTGMGRVLLSFAHALIVVIPLLALTATGQVVGRARDDGTLELLLGHGVGRSAHLAGVALVRLAVLLVPLALLLAGSAVFVRLAWRQPIPWIVVGRSLLTCSALVVAFTGLGIAVSTYVREPAKGIVVVLVLWAICVALLDFGVIGTMLRFPISPRLVFALAAANPVEAARLALLSGVTPELAALGQVGFYLSTRIGSNGLLVAGTVWP